MSKDLFSKQAVTYAQYRPGYPKELVEYIVSFVPQKQTAWDCATGNGQAAILLANHFQQVVATDTSEKQLSQAIPHPKITYAAGAAETTSFADNSFDLITVAQAYHWFNFEAFHREAIRVGKPNAIVAVWGYGLVRTHDKQLNDAIYHYYTAVMGKYWDAERKYVDEKYVTVPFHFNELPRREFSIDVQWNMEDFLGYLGTWSSLQHFIKQNNYSPVEDFAKELKQLWNDDKQKSFSFPLFLRIGRVEK